MMQVEGYAFIGGAIGAAVGLVFFVGIMTWLWLDQRK